jgi:uncharacterized surface protein with fasciclin (FAS1) repeats
MSQVLQKLTAISIGAIIAIASVAIFSTSQAGAWGWRQQSSQPNIAEVAIENGNFKTLVTALQCTGLDKVVVSKWVRLTVFAPTDAAFSNINLNPENVCDSFSTRELRNILLYHVSWGKKDSSVVTTSDSLRMLNWRKAPITTVPVSEKAPLGFQIANAGIAAVDIPASNGIIHVVSDVMIP